MQVKMTTEEKLMWFVQTLLRNIWIEIYMMLRQCICYCGFIQLIPDDFCKGYFLQ